MDALEILIRIIGCSFTKWLKKKQEHDFQLQLENAACSFYDLGLQCESEHNYRAAALCYNHALDLIPRYRAKIIPDPPQRKQYEEALRHVTRLAQSQNDDIG